jgi:hypothetical protein
VQSHLGNSWNATEEYILKGGLSGGSQRNGIAIAPQAGGYPENDNFGCGLGILACAVPAVAVWH